MTNKGSDRGWAAIRVATTRADEMPVPDERQQIEAVVVGDPTRCLDPVGIG